MSEDRRKPGWAFWTTVMLSLGIVYVLSFGPARASLGPRGLLSGPDPVFGAYQAFYRPVFWAIKESPLAYLVIDRYCAIWQRGL